MSAWPRLPRHVLAGLLLFGAVLTVTALLARPGFRWSGVLAAAIFIPLWYALAVLNAWLGVASAGYPLRAEAQVFVPVFGLPALVAGVLAGVGRASWDGGPVVGGARFGFVLLAGLALWAAIVVLIGLLSPGTAGAAGFGLAVLVFAPLWLLFCVANLLVGVRAAGNGVGGELLILLVDLVVPVAVAVGMWQLAARRRVTARA
jgi:hypothetical protein